jgi:hypothetical protein
VPDDDPLAEHRAFCGAIWSGIMARNAEIGDELRRRQEEDARMLGDRIASPRPTSWAEERKAELRLTDGMGIR